MSIVHKGRYTHLKLKLFSVFIPTFLVSSCSPPHSQLHPCLISTQLAISKVTSANEPHPLLDATLPLVCSSSSSSISTSSSPPYNSLTSSSSLKDSQMTI